MTIATRWADNDAYGHVNNTVFYQWFDTAVNAWLVEAGLLDIEPATRSAWWSKPAAPIRAAELPRRCRGGNCGRAARHVERHLPHRRVRRRSAEPAAQGHFTHVYVGRDSRRPAPLPASGGKIEALPSRRPALGLGIFGQRAISSPAGVTLSTTPMPWPDPQCRARPWPRLRTGSSSRRARLRQVVRVEAGSDDRGAQIIAADPGEQRRSDDVGRAAFDDRLLIFVRRALRAWR